jgi:phage tail-like protein
MDANGDPIKSWNFFDAYPVKWSLSDFNAMKNEVVVESISIKYSSFVALEE